MERKRRIRRPHAPLGGRSILGAAGTENSGRLAAVYGDNRLITWDAATGVEITSRSVTCVPLNAYPNPFVAVTADGSSSSLHQHVWRCPDP